MIELEAGNAFAIRQTGGFGELAQLSVVDERTQDVLLDSEIAVDDCRHRLRDTEIRHVIGRGLRAQQEVTDPSR